MKVALFLCTGNYYRSRFAEEFFKFEAPIECPGWTAVSRGIAVDFGIDNVGPIARSTVQALEKLGISLDPLLARMPLQLEIADLESAHHIVALKKAEHFPLMQERFPSWPGTSDPGRIEYWHIHDTDRVAPEHALPFITRRVRRLMKQLSSKTTEIAVKARR